MLHLLLNAKCIPTCHVFIKILILVKVCLSICLICGVCYSYVNFIYFQYLFAVSFGLGYAPSISTECLLSGLYSF